jgi:hypothetical protein
MTGGVKLSALRVTGLEKWFKYICLVLHCNTYATVDDFKGHMVQALVYFVN